MSRVIRGDFEVSKRTGSLVWCFVATLAFAAYVGLLVGVASVVFELVRRMVF